MRRSSIVLAVLAALALGGGVLWFGSRPHPAASNGTQAAAATWYTCGMHPEVVQDHPGECPKCGMKLHPMSADRAAALGLTAAGAQTAEGERKVLHWKSSMNPGEVYDHPGKDSMGMDLVPVYADEGDAGSAIRIDPVTEQDMGVRTDTVTRGPVRHTVRTVGYVDYDETSLADVTTKVGGWIQTLHVAQTGVQVHRGDPLFELYSPQLFSAQEEYLSALRNLQHAAVPSVPGSKLDSQELLRAARTRLEYFDVSSDQIDELERTRRIRKTLTIRAPFTGIVTKKDVVEGQMIKAGETLFKIADLSTVWVIGKVYEQDVPYVQLGQEAFMTLTYLPGRTYRGRLTYIYPFLESKTRELSVRLEFHNPGYELKPGMYATVTVTAETAADAVLVPDTAVLRTGTRDVVFTVPSPGRFEAREILLGLRSDDHRLQVLSGLSEGETVVVSGQFLLDSESRLREAALKMRPAGAADGATPIKSATRAHEGKTGAATNDVRTYWVCPMPEHGDTLYDRPGTCPLCGMPLVPTERHGGHLDQPHIAWWTCPMPEHHAVHEKGPGKCPICGMTLIPVPEGREGAAR
jgi:RND family efflux transporter MFP subunit